MSLDALGYLVQVCWTQIPNHFPQVNILESVVMPNHIHGIIEIGYQQLTYPRCSPA